MIWIAVAIFLGLAIGLPTAVAAVYALRLGHDANESNELDDGYPQATGRVTRTLPTSQVRDLLSVGQNRLAEEWERLVKIDELYCDKYQQNLRGGWNSIARRVLRDQRAHRVLMHRVAKQMNAAGFKVTPPPNL